MVVENLNVSPGVLWYSLKPSISLVVVLCLLMGMGVPSFGGSWFESVMISVFWLSFLLVIVLLFVFGLIGWLPMGLYVLLSLPFFLFSARQEISILELSRFNWDFGFRRALSPVELEEWHRLAALFLVISETADSVTWPYSASAWSRWSLCMLYLLRVRLLINLKMCRVPKFPSR